MKLKKELPWIIASLLVSLVIVAVTTGFRFQTFDIQLHDTYYVINSFTTIKYLTCLFIIGIYMCKLTLLLAERYPLLAFVVAIINPIAAILLTILTAMLIQVIILTSSQAEMDLSGNFLLLAIFVIVLVFQAIMEIRMIRIVRNKIFGTPA